MRQRPSAGALGAMKLGRAMLLGCAMLPISAAAITTCSATIDSFSFGALDLTGNADLTGTVQVTCATSGLSIGLTVQVRYCLSINAGSGGAGALLTPRRMTNATLDTLDFGLFLDAARTQPAGSMDTPSTSWIAGSMSYLAPLGLVGTGSATHVLHARVPAQTLAAIGDYQSSFSGAHTSLNYRYTDALLTPSPASCSAGGNGGGTAVRAPFMATASVTPACSLIAADDMDFGTLPGVITSAANATSNLSLTCRRRTAWQISLGDGLHASGGTRHMRDAGGNHLNYELYKDVGHSQRFGHATQSERLLGSGTGTNQSVAVYGRIPAPQTVPPGAYADRVIVTITY